MTQREIMVEVTSLDLAKRRSTWLANAAAIAAALLAFATALADTGHVLGDSDMYLHIAAGQWMLAHLSVPHVDIFSHSMSGARWIAHEWLAEVASACAYDGLGWAGPVFITAACYGLAIAFLARALLRIVDPPIAAAGVVIAWGLTYPHLQARPHVLAYPLLVVWVQALATARSFERTPSLWLTVVMVLWANLHASFMAGLGLAALCAGEAIFEALDRRAALVQVRRWSLFLASSFVAACVTPNGLDGLSLPFRVIGMDYFMSVSSEWKSPNFQQSQPIETALLLMLFGAWYFGIRLPVTRIAMLLVLVHLTLVHQRNAEILGLAGSLLAAPAIARGLGRPREATRLLGADPSCFARQRRNTRLLLLAAMISLCAAVADIHYPIAPKPDSLITPAKAVAVAQARRLSGPVLNDPVFGGYLIFSGIAPFVDARAELYGNGFFERYDKLGELPGLLAEYKIGWTLLKANTPRAVLMDFLPGWRRLYAGDIAVIHVRDDDDNSP